MRFDPVLRQVHVPVNRLITHDEDLLKTRSRWNEIRFDCHNLRIVSVFLEAPESIDQAGGRCQGFQWINIGINRLASSSNAMNRKMTSTLPVFRED